MFIFFFFSSRRRHTRCSRDWSSDVCSSDLSQGYYGLASVFIDEDDDGWVDLAVANDSVPRYLYRNLHDGTFEDVGYLSGFVLTNEGLAQAWMGIAVGDYNGDGKVDLFITTFSDDYKTLYRNDGDNNFSDVTYRAG